MVVAKQKLYGRSNDFFDLNSNAFMKLSRRAARDVCLVAASRDLIVVKIEGGIWRDGRFEARLDAIWDGEDPPKTQNEADKNNVRAAAFIKSTDSAYNAFIVTSAPTGYAHRAPAGAKREVVEKG
ncbi:MAG TPA: colicin immunity protein [Stellaceae bacterium]|nr:colicin immunity protein [Stellaceae bacterium]